MTQNIIIRHECESDYRIVENLTREAFWNVYRPGCTEHYPRPYFRTDKHWPRIQKEGLWPQTAKIRTGKGEGTGLWSGLHGRQHRVL